MPHLSQAQEIARQQIHRLAQFDLTPEQVGSRILDSIERTVPSAGMRLFGIDPPTLLINRLLAAREEDPETRHVWLRDVYLATPEVDFLQFPNLMRAGVPVLVFQRRQNRSLGVLPWMREVVTEGQWQRQFFETETPAGGALFASFAAQRQWIACLGLHRRDPTHAFKPAEAAFLRLVGPSIGRAMESALAREQARLAAGASGVDVPTVPGMLALGDDGRVTFSTATGEHWSDLVLDAEPVGNHRIPTVVGSLAAWLRRGDEKTDGHLVVPTRAGLVRIEAARSLSDDSTAIVFVPERKLTLPEIPAWWPLTPSERRVVALVVGGQTDRAIADQLFVSASTVRTHLRHVFETLDVHSRTELLARLFAETIRPRLMGDDDAFDGAIVPHSDVPR